MTAAEVRIWLGLTPMSRAAMLSPGHPMHPNTRRALVRRGLLGHDGARTVLGKRVVRHRPVRTAWPAVCVAPLRKPIMDLHLPDGDVA